MPKNRRCDPNGGFWSSHAGFPEIRRKKTSVEGLYWPISGWRRVRHRPLGVAQAPPADRGGSRISTNGRSPFCGSSSSRSGPELEKTKKRGPASGSRWRFRLFPVVCGRGSQTRTGKILTLGLDTTAAVGRGAGRPGEEGVVDVYETLQQRRPVPIAPDQGHKRAAGPWPGLNLVPPALCHVWCHAKTPEDQHSRWSPGGPGAGARTGQRT